MLASRNASRKLLNLTRIRCARLRTTSRILKYTTNNNSTLSKEDQPSTHEPHDVSGSLDDFIRKKLDEARTIEMIANGQEVEEQSVEAQSVQTSDTVNIGSQDDVDATKVDSSFEWPGESWSNDWGQDALSPAIKPLEDASAFPEEPDIASKFGSNVERPPHEDSPYKDAAEVTDGLPHPTVYYTKVVEGIIQEKPQGTKVMKDLKSPTPMRPIAQLEHGLDRVLFNPGVHWVQDPRSRVYNFSPRLQAIPKVEEFAFDRVTGFIKSSSDNDLRTLAKQENCRFVGSTSSLTGMLSHIYFLLSSIRPPTLDQLSHGFMKQTTKSSGATPTFSYGQRLPVSILLNYKDGVYATDYDPSDPGMTERNILTWQGTLLEKYLTASPEEFETLLRKNPPADGPVDTRREAYRYAKCGNYVMRSQLDCYDPRLPGTGVFDLKTRAALPIRRDLFNYEPNSGYLIRSLQGSFESFEREYYDLIRAAFLKYSFQARIGNMDGIFAAYHNTARIFGFQYIPLEEMDQALYGHKDVGMRIFEKCLNMLEVVSSEVTQLFPNESVSCLWDTEEDGHEMHVWVQPKEWKVELGPPPLIQLDVQATSYVDGKRVFGHELPESIAGNKWELRWTIKTAELSPKQIFQNKQAAKEKQSIYWSLPAGMDKEQAAKWISDLDFAGKGSPSTLAKPSIFRPPDDFVKHLRYLSRCGKKETDRMERAEAGKTKIIWGSPESTPVVLGEGKVQKAEKAEGKSKQTKHEKPGKQLSNAELKTKAERKARKDTRRLSKHKEKKAAMRKAAVLAELRQEQPQSEPIQRVPEFRAASETSMAMTRNKSAHVQSILGKIYLRYSDDESNPTVNASLPTLTLPWTAAKKEEVFE